MGYILGFVVGLIVEELLDAFLTGGIKNVADIARYLKKSVDVALETIQNMGDAAVDLVKKGKRKLDDTAAGFINFMETINNLLRTTMDPDGFSKFLNDIAEKFEEFILGVKIDLVIAGQQRLDISLGVFANFKDLDIVLGKVINVATRKKISRLGIKILQDTENKAKFLVKSNAFEEVDGLLINKKELKKFFEDLKDIDTLEQMKNFYFKKTRKANSVDINILSSLRKKLDAGWRKNVAFTKGEIGGEIIDLKSKSGSSIEYPNQYDNFEVINPNRYNYKNGPESFKINHTEQKQIEYLYDRFKNTPRIFGKIEIVSDLKICNNCEYLIEAFSIDFPNIRVTRIWVNDQLIKK